MAARASSKNWQKRQARDPFVKEAKRLNYRARSAFKLEEIDRRFKIFEYAQIVIDLGSAPGAWTQYASLRLKQTKQNPTKKKLISIDLLEMTGVDNAILIQGDFTSIELQQKIINMLDNCFADLIISDMSPNISGVKVIDDARTMHLCESAHEFSLSHLNTGGHFVCKVFQGSYFEEFFTAVKQSFKTTNCFKPISSRKQSREVYVIGLNKK